MNTILFYLPMMISCVLHHTYDHTENVMFAFKSAVLEKLYYTDFMLQVTDIIVR